MPSSYNGWPASANPADFGGLDNSPVPGTNVKLAPGVRAGDVATVLFYVADQLNRRVEPIDSPLGDDWGYNFRPNTNNPSTISCHGSATAFDYNATRHPNGARGTFSGTQVNEIRRILAEVDNVVDWGGDFTGTKDEMHFEISGNSSAVARVAQRLRGGGVSTTPPAPPASPSPKPTIQQGSQGEDVKLVQRFLGVVPATDPGYGTFGPKTDTYVRNYQRNQGLTPDGVVGPLTWARILSGLNGASGGGSGAPSTGRPTLSRGSSGAAVSDLQAYLNRVFPAYSRLAVDGAFGPGTEAVVREFQRRSGIADDGVVGPTTWAKLGF